MPQTLFGTPPTITFADNAEDTYSMSTRVTFAVDGRIVGIRFWGTTNPLATTPLAQIYSTAGVAQIAAASFPALVTAAWNTCTLPTPFAVTAGQTFDITVGPRNRYAGAAGTFAAPLVVGDLTGTAGRFISSAASPPPFPTTSSTAWYGIDVLFEADVSAVLDATLPALTADLTGEATEFGQLDATLPALTGDLVGLVTQTGVLNALLPAFTAAFTGNSAAGGQTVGPCGWTIPDPLCCADEWAALPLAVQSAARDYAATVLWAATGRQFGLCQVSVRPCGMRQCAGGGEFWGYDWSGGTWVPYIFNGTWFNCACPGACCCEPRCQLRLMGPVEEMVEVLIGGVAVNPDTYYVYDEHWLVRTGGECWPFCADLNELISDSTLEVTYLRGTPVPNALLRAAATLACEWGKACVGSDSCRLSNRVTSVIRQGITIDMVSPDDMLDSGLTGLWEVDTVIRSYNPHRTVERLRIYAPELNVPKTVTWP